jgi:putative ABC transport system permease protein
MLWYHLKIAFRNIAKGRWIYLINVAGLTISLAVVILLSAYISTELNKGQSLPHRDEIYQVRRGGSTSHSFPMIAMIREQVPEISAVTGFHSIWATKKQFIVDDKKYDCEDFLYADSSFFDVFEHKVVYGDLKEALSSPDGAVLTQSASEKMFGHDNPVGKPFIFETTDFGSFNLKISAVIEDLPEGSILKFNGILPKKSLERIDWYKSGLDHWGNCNYSVFARIKDKSTNETENKINAVYTKTAPEWIQKDDGSFSLAAYKDLYFDGKGWGDLLQHNSLSLIKTLGLVALVILVVSWINYINLNTAQFDVNRRVYGIQKHLGASYRRLVLIGIIDSLPVVLIASVLSLNVAWFALPAFNYLLATSFKITGLFSNGNSFHVLAVLFVSVLVCGIIPVIIRRVRYRSNQNLSGSVKRSFSRNGLLVVQFCVSIVFILITMIMVRQSNFMQQFPTGYYSDNVIHLDMLSQIPDQREAFREELKRIPGILDVTFASDLICDINQPWGMSLNNKGEDKRISYSALQVDKNFFHFFGLKLTQGHDFGENAIKERQHIFNQTAMKNFGIDNMDEARITSYDNARGDIIGEVEDFKYKSMRFPVSNLGFLCQNPKNLSYAYLKTNTASSGQLRQLLAKIEGVWSKFVKDWPMEYGFLDESIKKMYEQDIRLNKAFTVAAVISILIACMGLLGVSIFNIDRRTKEVGIRKVNGAKVSEVMAMLNKDFVRWVVIAFVIAMPVAYYAMHKWLENFAYKTNLSWWIFALAGLLALGIALLTVSWQSWKAATRNPVEALRYE